MESRLKYTGDVKGEFSNCSTIENIRKEFDTIADNRSINYLFFKDDEESLFLLLHEYGDLVEELGYSTAEAEEIVLGNKDAKMTQENYLKLLEYTEIYNCILNILNFLSTNPICEITI